MIFSIMFVPFICLGPRRASSPAAACLSVFVFVVLSAQTVKMFDVFDVFFFLFSMCSSFCALFARIRLLRKLSAILFGTGR